MNQRSLSFAATLLTLTTLLSAQQKASPVYADEDLQPRVVAGKLELVDKRGNPIPANATIQINKHKSVKAKDALEELRKLDARLAERGLNLQSLPADSDAPESPNHDPAELQRQAAELKSKALRSVPVPVPSTVQLGQKHAEAESREPEALAAHSGTATTPSASGGPALGSEPIMWELERGNHKTLQGYLRGSIRTDPSLAATTVVSSLELGFSVLGKSHPILKVESSNRTGKDTSKGAASVKVTLAGVGTKTFSLGKGKSRVLQGNWNLGSVAYSFGRFPVRIYGYGFDVDLDLEGTGDVGYWIGMRPLALECKIQPKANLKAKAKADGLDLWLVKAGVECDLTLLETDTEAYAMGAIQLVNKDPGRPIAAREVSVKSKTKFLSGKLKAYVKIFGKKIKFTIWDFDGFQFDGYVYSNRGGLPLFGS